MAIDKKGTKQIADNRKARHDYFVLEQIECGIELVGPPLWPQLAEMPLLAAVVGALFVGVGAGLSVRAGGASGGDDALAMCIAHVTGMGIQWAYLSTDLVVLGLSLTYIPLRRIGYSLLTVLISGQLIGLVQRLPLPWDRAQPETME